MKTTVEHLKNNIVACFHGALWIGAILACTLTLAVHGQREQDDFAAKEIRVDMLVLYVVLNWFLNVLLILAFLVVFITGAVNVSRLVYAEAVEAAKQEILASGAHVELDSNEEQV